MTLSVGVSGTYKPVAALSVGVSGVWKPVIGGWVGVGGAWKVFYGGVSLPATLNEDVTASPGPANATMTFNSDGSFISSDGSPVGSWFMPEGVGVGAGYEIRWTVVSGTLSTGTTGTWQSLGSNITYGRNRVAAGVATAVGTVEIRDASTLAVLATTTVTLEAEVI